MNRGAPASHCFYGIMNHDQLERRCPRLGSPVHFGYCRQGIGPEPCFKVLDCWWETFDVADYFRQRMSPEAFALLANPAPPNKVAGLVEIIQQARQRIEEEK